MGDNERLIIIVGGAALLWRGLRRGDWAGMVAAAAGGGMLYMGATGRNPLARALGIRFIDTRECGRRVEVVKSVTINRPAAELFAFWRDFRNLPRIMPHLRSIDVVTDRRSHWIANAPAGFTVEWDAEIVNEKPGTLIAWQSCEEATWPIGGSYGSPKRPPGAGPKSGSSWNTNRSPARPGWHWQKYSERNRPNK